MGITGVWSLLQPFQTPINLSQLQGCVVAIDVPIWLSQGENVDLRAMFLHRICALLHHGVKPVFVFDSGSAPEKRRTQLERLVSKVTGMTGKTKHLLKRAAVEMVCSSSQSSQDSDVSPTKTVRGSEGDLELEDTSQQSQFSGSQESSISGDDPIQIEERSIEPDVKDLHESCMTRLRQRFVVRNPTVKERKRRNSDDDIIVLSEYSQEKQNIRDAVSYDSDIEIVEQIEPSGNKPSFITINDESCQDEAVPDIEASNNLTDHTNGSPTAYQISDALDERRTDVVKVKEKGTICEASTSVDLQKQENNGEIAVKTCVEEREEKPKVKSEDREKEKEENCPEPVEVAPSELYKDEWSSSESEWEEVDDGEEVEWNPGLGDEYKDRPLPGPSSQLSAAPDGAHPDVLRLLSLFGLPFVVAAGEAEVECAQLVALGKADLVMTEDSDILAFTSEFVIRGFPKKLTLVNVRQASDYGLFPGVIRVIAVLSGCDYCKGVGGVGPTAALQLIAELLIKTGKVFESRDALSNDFVEWFMTSLETWLRPAAGGDTPTLKKLRPKFAGLIGKGISLPESFYKPYVTEFKESLRFSESDPKTIENDLLSIGVHDQKILTRVRTAVSKWNSYLDQENVSDLSAIGSAVSAVKGHSKSIELALATIREHCTCLTS